MRHCPLCHAFSVLTHQLNGFSYFACNRCLTLFLNPKPKKKLLQEYYKRKFDYTAGSTNEMIIRDRSHIILRNLIKQTPHKKPLTLLDIGSGYGYFLDTAKRCYPVVDAMGVEPNISLSSSSIRRFSIKAKQTDFSTFYFKYKKTLHFDFITLIHTIEHIPYPKQMIYQAISLLNPGGILYIETPNLDSHLYRVEKNTYTFLTPPDHLYIFSQKSIKMILPQSSYVCKISTYSYSEHFMGILKKLLRVKPVQPLQLYLGRQNNITRNIKGKKNIISEIKYLLFDRLIAVFFYRFLNLHCQGSILELYIKKK